MVGLVHPNTTPTEYILKYIKRTGLKYVCMVIYLYLSTIVNHVREKYFFE